MLFRSPRCGLVSFLPLWGPSTLWTRVLTLRGVRPRYGLVYVFYPRGVRPLFWKYSLTLRGVHQRCGLVSFLPLWGPSTFWTRVLTLRRVRPRCGLVSFLPLWGSFALWTRVLTLRGVRPRCGHTFFTLVGSVHFSGLESWPFVGSVHVMDLCRNFNHIGSACFVYFADKAGSQPT